MQEYERRPDRIKRREAWIRNNPDYKWSYHSINNHRLSGCKINFSIDWLREKAKATANCEYCGLSILYGGHGHKPNMATLDRYTNTKTLTKKNIRIVCMGCNAGKGNGSLQEYYDRCMAVARLHSL